MKADQNIEVWRRLGWSKYWSMKKTGMNYKWKSLQVANHEQNSCKKVNKSSKTGQEQKTLAAAFI